MDKNKLRKIQLFLTLVVVVLTCTLLLILLKQIKNVQTEANLVEDSIEGTMWPIEEVPLIGKEGMVAEDVGDYMCNVTFESGVTYEDLRKYLIELYNKGFVPNESVGSQNPKYMTTSLEGTDISNVFWLGEKDKYSISVLWAEENAIDEFGMQYDNNLEISLFINSSDILFYDDIEETPKSETFDESVVSGESSFSGESGDVGGASGE